jgi:hypothetical protein
MSLRHRLARLERKHPPPPPPPSPEELLRERRWEEIMDRLTKIILAALPLLAEDQQEQVVRALEQLANSLEGPLGTWHLHLSRGWSRLPEVTPEVGKMLLLTWLSPDVEGSSVCRQCGLEYATRRQPPLSLWYAYPGKGPPEGVKPEFFEKCPSCGASRLDMDWPHLIEGKKYPWMEWDCFMGIDGSRKNRFK